jgi:hypothetical protein
VKVTLRIVKDNDIAGDEGAFWTGPVTFTIDGYPALVQMLALVVKLNIFTSDTL